MLGNDDKSQTNLYGSISQNRANRNSYVARGHLAFRRDFLHQLTDDPAVDEICSLVRP